MKKNWWLGFGFFSISLTWGLYNAFVPLFLQKLVISVTLIGFLMTLDNYIALFLQPLIGNLSDKTDTRFGKRMPFIIIGMPLAALFVSLLPYHSSLLTLVTFMLLLNISMALFRTPTIALMPDITLEKNRTKANGIINFMGGIGAIIAFSIGSKLYDIDKTVPFLFAGAIFVITLAILLVKINEKHDIISNSKQLKEKIYYKEELNRPTIFLLLAIFFWFISYQGMEALFTLYGVNQLGLSESQASFSLAFFSLSFVLFAIPSGWLGAKFGKKAVIIVGIIGLGAMFLFLNFADSAIFLRGLLFIGGFFWACININSYPFVVATGNEKSIGTRTGLYYLVSSLAAITGPPLFGLIVDLTSYNILFFAAALSMFIALLCIFNVKHTEQYLDS